MAATEFPPDRSLALSHPSKRCGIILFGGRPRCGAPWRESDRHQIVVFAVLAVLDRYLPAALLRVLADQHVFFGEEPDLEAAGELQEPHRLPSVLALLDRGGADLVDAPGGSRPRRCCARRQRPRWRSPW